MQASFADSIQRAKAAGLIRRDFPVEAWFDGRFVDRALTDRQWDKVWPGYDAGGQAQ
ncbi:hypothetical protein [Brenneria tiliae]|uniref:Uncharacterized protein n=1 Tax=Brenneria tiliae TaxID=2914984 RepID=A0ABT0MX49_9GAMM|nr:hypothetical protein [Brenneria tiliae]MCL2894413.1 hypothetical protein [Brenneria tiliae]